MVFPLPKKKLNDMQKACSKFIWRNALRRIALRHSHPKLTKGGTRTCNSDAQVQSPLFCDSDQAISRGIQWNKLLELLDRKGFEKSKAKFRGTPGTRNTCFIS